MLPAAGPFPSRPALRALLATAVVLAAGGCSGFPLACTSELGLDVQPRSPRIAVGESFAPRVTEITCGGRERRRARAAWTAEDPTIVSVDNAANRVTGVAPGETRISADGPMGPVVLPVTVVSAR